MTEPPFRILTAIVFENKQMNIIKNLRSYPPEFANISTSEAIDILFLNKYLFAI